jgi:hypothetical protein
MPQTSESYDLDFEYTTKGIRPTFAVLADGTLYAEAAKISGEIEATYGNIAGWKISDKGLVASEGELNKITRLSAKAFEATLGLSEFDDDVDREIASKDWLFVVGSNFGITERGEVWALKGVRVSEDGGKSLGSLYGDGSWYRSKE